MTPLAEYALTAACAAICGVCLMIAWAQWVALGTRHSWTDAVNRLGQRVTQVDRTVQDINNRVMTLEHKEHQ